MIVTAPDALRDQLSQRKTTRGKASLCLRLRPRTTHLAEPAEGAKFALRSLARRIQQLDEEIAALDEHLATLVATAAPRTLPTRADAAGGTAVKFYELRDNLRTRRRVATAMSRQAYRLERQLTAIRDGAQTRLKNPRAAMAVWQLAAKQAEFGHLVIEGYRKGSYTPVAALVRTLFEDTTLLAWMSLPDDPGQQRDRTIRAVFARDHQDA